MIETGGGDMRAPSLDGMFLSLKAQADEKRGRIRKQRDQIVRLTRAAQLLKNDAVLAQLQREQAGLATVEAELAEIEGLLAEPHPEATGPEPVAPPLSLRSEPVSRAPEVPPAPAVAPPLATPVVAERVKQPVRRLRKLPTVPFEETFRRDAVPAPVAEVAPLSCEPGLGEKSPVIEESSGESAAPPVVPARPVETAVPSWTAPERFESRPVVALLTPKAAEPVATGRRATPLLAVDGEGADPEARETLARLVEAAETRPRYGRTPEPVRPLGELEALLETLDGWLLRECKGTERDLLEFRARLAEFRQAAKERKTYSGDTLLWNEELKVFLGKRGQFWPGVRMDELDWRNEYPKSVWDGRAAGYRRIQPAIGALLWVESVLEGELEDHLRGELAPVLESATAPVVLFQRFLAQGAEISDSGIRLWLKRAEQCAEQLEVRLSSLKPYASDAALEHLGARLPERLAAAQATAAGHRELILAWDELDELVVRPRFGRDPADAALFQGVIRTLRARGVPAADVRLRNTAAHLHDLLDDAADTPVIEVRREWHLHMRRTAEKERQQAQQNPGSRKAEESLSPEMQRKLEAVRPHLEGQIVVMFGGLPDKRHKRLERTFGIQELRWPPFPPSDKIDRYAREMGKPGVAMIWINKWNSCHIGEFKKMAAQYKLPMVVFNKGLGLVQVIETLHEHLVVHPIRRGLAPKEALAA